TTRVKLPGMPRPQTFLQLLGVHRGIARCLECFPREPSRRLVMLTAKSPTRHQAGDHVGPDHADQSDEVPDDFLTTPFGKCLVDAERKPKVHGASEVLLGAVEPVDGGEL